MLRRIVPIMLCFLVMTAGQSYAQKRTRLAVASFVSGCANLPKESTVGQGIADMIITELFKVKQFEIIERNRLETLLAEKNLAQTDLVQPNSAAEAAKIIQCDAIVVGSITEYSVAQENSEAGLFKSSKALYTVSLQFRIIDAGTGQTRLTATATGTVEKKGSSADIGAVANRFAPISVGRIGKETTGQDAFYGEASQKAVREIVEKIRYAFPPEGYVIKIDGDTILIDLGKSADIQKGANFKVVKVGEAIKHPVTGQMIPGETEEIGVIQVADVVNESLSKCVAVSGKEKIAVGNKIIGEVRDYSVSDNGGKDGKKKKKKKEKEDE